MFPHPYLVNMSFEGAGGQIKFHCAMKEIYEMPQMTVVEMELGCPVMDGTGVGSDMPGGGLIG